MTKIFKRGIKNEVEAYVNEYYTYDKNGTNISDNAVKAVGECNVFTCKFSGCTKVCTHNFKNQPALYCKRHADAGMEFAVQKRCNFEECTSDACYNYEGQPPMRCRIHALTDMVDLLNPTCKVCNQEPAVEKYAGHCRRCYVYTFPENTLVRNYKTKERVIADHIREAFPECNFIMDRKISGGISARRPDIFLDCTSYVVVIEIDENQHMAYDCTCENKRLTQLFQDAGCRPLAMIRFNPDEYIDCKKVAHTSCWSKAASGLCAIKKNKASEWDTRIKVLSDTLKYVLEDKVASERKEIEVIHLFYNGWAS
jgi:hypothetical protein